jgi:ribonucleotide monophosphatase NagD (HAD superfamily)
MVGDDLRTDLAPARRLGMRTILVLTGKGAAERALLTDEESRRIVPVADLAAAAQRILAQAR